MRLNLSHISYQRLVDWSDGRLTPDEQTTLAEHLATCTRCRSEAARIERILRVMRSDDSRDAPPALIAQAVAAFRRRVVEPNPTLIERLAAVLRFESTPLAPAMGLRSESAAERQLLFTANEFDIDLRLSEENGGWRVRGQLLGADVGAGIAQLVGSDRTFQAEIDASSSFALSPAPAGRYSLILTWPLLVITIDEVVLGSNE